MAYTDPIAEALYERYRATLPEVRLRRRVAMARLRQKRKERGEREHQAAEAPIQRLQGALSAWK